MSKNGLRTFSLHAGNESDSPVTDSLRAERGSLHAFATTNAIGLSEIDPETAARQHLRQALESRTLPQFTAPDVNGKESEFRSLGTETVALTGTRVVKFRQAYNKIPVYGSLVTVELDGSNELLSLNSSLGEPANVDPVARLSPGDALSRVRALAGDGAETPGTAPRLCYYYDAAADRWRLVYVFEDVPVRRREGGGAGGPMPLLMDYVIDAHTGELVAELPRTPSADVSREEKGWDGLGRERTLLCMVADDGSRSLRDDRRNVHTHDFRFQDLDSGRLPGDFVGNPPDPWDGAAVSAHANAAVVADFLRGTLLRNGIDNAGGPLVSSVNCVVAQESPDGRQWRNAAWVGTQMVYGQRSVGGQLRSYAVAVDVVGHEMFHGVTDRTSRLQYAAESGALNESYSDIFGALISNFDEPDMSAWSWEMGEDLEATGIPIRDLSDPARYGQPAHMRDYQNLPVTRFGDYGGVHVNSGIHNKAAYNLMTSRADGGGFLFDPRSLAILFYVTLTQQLSRTSLFSDSRRGAEITGRTLFRNDPPAVRDAKVSAISAAFEGVGVR
jgi:Zn-dependent metalloprotease